MNENKPIFGFDEANKLFGQSDKNQNETSHPVESSEKTVTHEKHENIAENISSENKNINWKPIGFWLIIIIGAFLLGFAIVNGPAIAMKVSQWFKSLRGTINLQEQIYNPGIQIADTNTKSNSEVLADNHLIIPKINVDAPIQWEIDAIDVENNLSNGLVHYKETAYPDQVGGNVFLTGHSSNFWWIKSDYNQVFALLGDLNIGDKMVVTYMQKKYVYEVFDKFVVDPKQVEVLNSIEGKSTLTLMSCVPIGTNFRRLIVQSELLYIDEGKPSETPTNIETQTPAETSPGTQKPIQNEQTEKPASEPSNQPSTDLFLPSI